MSKSVGDMTPEELDAFLASTQAERRQQFDGEPVARVSRVKREDYPHWDLNVRQFVFRDGTPAEVRRAEAAPEPAVLRGWRPIAGRDRHAVVVEVAGRTYALRRADGEPWAEREVAGMWFVNTPGAAPSVEAWEVSSTADDVPAPGGTETWTIRPLAERGQR